VPLLRVVDASSLFFRMHRGIGRLIGGVDGVEKGLVIFGEQ
jgi:hypothetical protein